MRHRIRLPGGAGGLGGAVWVGDYSPAPNHTSLSHSLLSLFLQKWPICIGFPGWVGGQRNLYSYKDRKLKEQRALWKDNIKRMRLKRGSLASLRLPCSIWISKRPRDPLPLFTHLTKLWFSHFPFGQRMLSYHKAQFSLICVILRAQRASNELPISALSSLGRKWVNLMFKGILLPHTTSTWSSPLSRAFLLGQNLLYSWSSISAVSTS